MSLSAGALRSAFAVTKAPTHGLDHLSLPALQQDIPCSYYTLTRSTPFCACPPSRTSRYLRVFRSAACVPSRRWFQITKRCTSCQLTGLRQLLGYASAPQVSPRQWLQPRTSNCSQQRNPVHLSRLQYMPAPVC